MEGPSFGDSAIKSIMQLFLIYHSVSLAESAFNGRVPLLIHEVEICLMQPIGAEGLMRMNWVVRARGVEGVGFALGARWGRQQQQCSGGSPWCVWHVLTQHTHTAGTRFHTHFHSIYINKSLILLHISFSMTSQVIMHLIFVPVRPLSGKIIYV